MDPYIAAIYPWPMDWAPQGFMFCHGQILNIKEYQALCSVIGTTYGGDGVTTFALPNLTGRVPVGVSRQIGQGVAFGSNTTTLILNTLPAHSHTANAYSEGGTTSVPTGNLMANTKGADGAGTDKDYVDAAAAGTLKAMAAATIGSTGKGAPFSIVQPTTAMNFIICVQGAYPPRA
jgi:microcystin-dependent protein